MTRDYLTMLKSLLWNMITQMTRDTHKIIDEGGGEGRGEVKLNGQPVELWVSLAINLPGKMTDVNQ